jgi:hypothetical protein
MNQHDRTEERLAAGLHQLAGSGRPTYRDDILQQVDRTRQRPAWTFPERWIPMTVITFPRTRQRGAPRTLKLLAVAGVSVALAAGLVAGAMRLLPPSLLQATLIAPVVTDDAPWQNWAVDGITMLGGMDHGPGGLLVTDVASDRIIVVDGAGIPVMEFGESGRLPGQFEFQRDPIDPQSAYGGAAWLPDGAIVVADSGNHRVQVIRKVGGSSRGPGTWTAVDGFGAFGIEDGQFLDPIDVAVTQREILVVDDQRDDITRFDHDGELVGIIAEPGSGDGQLDFTGGIATDDEGNLFNADYGNGRVQSWDPDHRFRWSTAIPDGGDADHGQPIDVDVDESGFIWVTTNDGRLLTLAPDGRIVGGWSDLAKPGEDVPLAVAASGDGVLFVGEMLTGRIHRLRTAQQEIEPLPMPVATPTSLATPGPIDPSPVFFGPAGTFPVAFTVAGPAGWNLRGEDSGEVELVLTGDEGISARFLASIPYEVYDDPCHPDDGLLAMGTTARDLAQAISMGRGMEPGPFDTTTIDGHPAVVFDLFNRVNPRSCSDPSLGLRQWRNVAHDGGSGFAQRTGFGAHQRIAVVDVDGTRVVFWTETIGAPVEAVRAAQELLGTLRIP